MDMNIELLSQLLRELLIENDKVILSGLGGFFADMESSYFSDDHSVIYPPRRRIFFRSSVVSDDELLEKLYAEKNNMSLEKSREIISIFLQELKNELNIKKNISFPNLGMMRATQENDYFFVVDRDLDMFCNNFGLDGISVNLDESVFEASPKIIEIESAIIPVINPLEKSNVKVSTKMDRSYYGGKENKWLVAAIIIVAILTAIVCLLIVYGDQLGYIIDSFLYTEEELKLIYKQ